MRETVHAQSKVAPLPLPAPARGGPSRSTSASAGSAEDYERSEGLSAERPTGVSQLQSNQRLPGLVQDVAHSPGQPLDVETRAFFEPRFGHDFSRVRVHSDAKAAESARAMDALALTVGNDVMFASGEFAPQTWPGRRLLAHELTHVVQQRFGTFQGSAAVPAESHEHEANKVANQIMLGGGSGPQGFTASSVSVQRACGNEVGKVEGCKGVSADIAGPAFHFKVGCDDFLAGEEKNLTDQIPTSLTSNDKLAIHGFASEEGPAELNINLSCLRAKKANSVLLGAGVPAESIDAVYAHGPTSGPRADRRSVVIDIFKRPRGISFEEQGLLNRLNRLGVAAKGEGGGGPDFQKVVDDLKKNLTARIDALSAGEPLPPDVDLIMKALMLWSKDPGNKWGEGSWDSNDLQMSAPEYVLVPASQYKCNAYVAEVIYQSLGLVFKVHEAAQAKGKYFPFQAREWGNAGTTISQFPVVQAPLMGDIWSDGHHTGIFLGEYAGKKLYISARDDGGGVFGMKDNVQKEHGVQIKYLPDGGVYRRYTP